MKNLKQLLIKKKSIKESKNIKMTKSSDYSDENNRSIAEMQKCIKLDRSIDR